MPHDRRALRFCLFVVGLLCCFTSVAFAYDQTSPNFVLEDGDVSPSGGYATTTNFGLFSLLGFPQQGSGDAITFSQLPAAVADPVVTAPVLSVTAGDGALSVSWTASSSTFAHVSNYKVGISTSPSGPFTLTDTALIRSYLFSGLTNSTTYYLRVSVFDGTTELIRSGVVAGTPTGSGSGGGGGGGGGGTVVENPLVVITGKAYPKSQVSIVRDGVLVATTEADPQANFSVSVSQDPGNFTFVVYTNDYAGRRSTTYSFQVDLRAGTTVSVGSIFLPPTIVVNEPEVVWGETVPILGQGAPGSSVVINVYSNQVTSKTTAGADGTYFYQFDTSPLEVGDHTARAKSVLETEISPLSDAASFRVVSEEGEIAPEPHTCGRADLTCDGRVNLIDFSIAAFWYHRPLTGSIIAEEKDVLNGDGVIDLKDLSIMAYYWTG